MIVGVMALFAVAVMPAADAVTAADCIPAFDAGAPFTFPARTPAAGAADPDTPDAGRRSDPEADAEVAQVPELSSADIQSGGHASPSDAAAAIPIDSHVPVWGKPEAGPPLVVFGDLECPTRAAH
jgi:hypothetical protein